MRKKQRRNISGLHNQRETSLALSDVVAEDLRSAAPSPEPEEATIGATDTIDSDSEDYGPSWSLGIVHDGLRVDFANDEDYESDFEENGIDSFSTDLQDIAFCDWLAQYASQELDDPLDEDWMPEALQRKRKKRAERPKKGKEGMFSEDWQEIY